MKSFGEQFRKQRKKKDINLKEAAEKLNVRSSHLEAIEKENFENFPADVYARGFIRNYAELLGLDSDSMVMKYVLNYEDSEDEPDKEMGCSYFIYWTSAGLFIFISIIMILFRFAWIDSGSGDEITIPVPRSQSPEATVLEGDTPHQQGTDPEVAELNLRVESEENTWLYVIFDGTRSKEMVLHPGDVLDWSAEDTIRLRLGNAGGIRLYYRDEPLPPLGPSGEVTDKIITLEEGNLKIKTVGGEVHEIIATD